MAPLHPRRWFSLLLVLAVAGSPDPILPAALLLCEGLPTPHPERPKVSSSILVGFSNQAKAQSLPLSRITN